MTVCSRCKKRPAVVFMTKLEGDKSTSEGLCIVCAKEVGLKPVDDMMKKFGITDEELEAVAEQMMLPGMDGDQDGENGDFEQGGSPVFPFLMGLGGNKSQEEKAQGKKGESDKKEKKRKFIDNYCDNLTEKAKNGKLDNIIGRDKEIARIIQILSRRQKNNPCLIGEAGVGKTAIAEGIAQKIIEGNVPTKLLGKEICLLDLTALVAGTQFRGQFESRVKGLIQEVKQAGNIILFIDEIHNLTGAGDADGAMSAANILKPALSRGEIQVIGATTFAEYRKFIEKDQALERRFQPVKVEEPSISDATAIIHGVKKYYENYHKVKVSDSMCELIVKLSERYITDRFLPDKAIDLLDEAAARRAIATPELAEYESLTKRIDEIAAEEKKQEEANEPDYEVIARCKSEEIQVNNRIAELIPIVEGIELSAKDLSEVIELWTGIPASKIEETEFIKVAHLEENMAKKVIGQDEAVKAVALAIKRSKAGLQKRKRPASFIFVGPTGVGKTELVKVLAGELFDSVEPLIRLDMSEYMEKYAVSRLVGSPPGYVGYEEAGQLTEKVRRRPYSVVLFDEIEKAHPDVMNLLLQILDEGRITDAQGRTVNFENTVICMTSNAGSSDKVALTGFGGTVDDKSKEKTQKALSEFLRPEFLSRVDEVIVFNSLKKEDLQKIADLMLDEIREPLREKGIALEYNDEVLGTLADLSDGGKFGARDLRTTIRKQIEDPIAELIVDSLGKFPRAYVLSVEDGKIAVKAD